MNGQSIEASEAELVIERLARQRSEKEATEHSNETGAQRK
jgi:hypothetical protein